MAFRALNQQISPKSLAQAHKVLLLLNCRMFKRSLAGAILSACLNPSTNPNITVHRPAVGHLG